MYLSFEQHQSSDCELDEAILRGLSETWHLEKFRYKCRDFSTQAITGIRKKEAIL